MKTSKKLNFAGVFMDHEKAGIYEPFSGEEDVQYHFSSIPKHGTRPELQDESNANRGSVLHEYKSNSKTQNAIKKYFSELSDLLRDYNHIVVFGSGVFISEFMNYLENDKHFSDIKVTSKTSDKMSTIAFKKAVKNFFEEDVAYRKIVI
ncbi:MAG: hypothetical protein KG003_04765 [Bacteroidetes bacterium]|nr:hypothetical protein [Bacteroidota bacterium]